MPVTPYPFSELHAAILQAAVTAGLALLCSLLYGRFRKPYFFWWAIAWTLYLLRLGAIMTFLVTTDRRWLYWHQVVTGWTALALLWAALKFSRQLRWRPVYLLPAFFPPLWSFIAIYLLQNFLLAAGPAVLFLSLATAWTGVTFWRDWRRTGSAGSLLLCTAFILWGAHHLDYPLLRARGAWNPWGYYLDILFESAVGAGILLLVLEDLQRGVGALVALSGDLSGSGDAGGALEALLRRPLSLRGVRGAAMYLREGNEGRFVAGIGACSGWAGQVPAGESARLIAGSLESGRPVFSGEWRGDGHDRLPKEFPFGAVLPIFQREAPTGALVMVGDARDPLTALDEGFLIALGQQVGAALERTDLNARLQARTTELERLAGQMVRQTEAERRRLSLALHDETAQLFAAVKLQLGVLREMADPALAPRIDRSLELIDTGIRGIRSITNDLRPALLDDLGLVPALRTLATDFAERTGLATQFRAGGRLPGLSEDAELAVYRALQEGLSNVARHAGATTVAIEVQRADGGLAMTVGDDGAGLDRPFDPARLEAEGHVGLVGMRERVQALGGELKVGSRAGGGVELRVWIPIVEDDE